MIKSRLAQASLGAVLASALAIASTGYAAGRRALGRMALAGGGLAVPPDGRCDHSKRDLCIRHPGGRLDAPWRWLVRAAAQGSKWLVAKRWAGGPTGLEISGLTAVSPPDVWGLRRPPVSPPLASAPGTTTATRGTR
jgi:hypothetical protein